MIDAGVLTHLGWQKKGEDDKSIYNSSNTFTDSKNNNNDEVA